MVAKELEEIESNMNGSKMSFFQVADSAPARAPAPAPAPAPARVPAPAPRHLKRFTN